MTLGIRRNAFMEKQYISIYGEEYIYSGGNIELYRYIIYTRVTYRYIYYIQGIRQFIFCISVYFYFV